jgi:hypothetical protein
MNVIEQQLRDPSIEEFDTRTVLREADCRRASAAMRIS